MRVRTRSLVIMLGQGITQASAIAVGIVLVRIISQETFGSYRQVLLVYTTLAALVSLQLDQSLYYFVPKLAPERRRALLAQTLGTALALAAAASAVMFATAGLIASFFDNPDIVPMLRIFSLFPFVEGIAVLIPAYMVGLDRSVRGSFYTAVKAVGRFVVVVAAFDRGFDIETVLCLVIANSGIITIVGSLDMLRLGGRGAFRVRKPMLKEQLIYAAPLWLGSITGTLNVQFDKLLISAVFDPVTYAIYFCGAIELPVVVLITSSVSAAMMATLVVLTTENRSREALELWQEGIRKCSLVILPCFGFFLPISRDFMVLLYGESYAAAAGPFAIYLFLLPVRVAVYGTLFRAIGKTRPVAISGGISLAVNIVVSSTLVVVGRGTPLAFIGPSLGTVIADFVAASYLLLRLRDLTGEPLGRLLRWRELGTTLALSGVAGFAVAAAAHYGLATLPIALKLAAEAAIFGFVLVAGILVSGHLRRDEWDLLRGAMRRVTGR